MVYSVLNCLYRCYHVPVSRTDLDSIPQPQNDNKRKVMICEGCSNRVQGLYIVSLLLLLIAQYFQRIMHNNVESSLALH